MSVSKITSLSISSISKIYGIELSNISSIYGQTISIASTWLDGWDYRKSITLSRASGAVTNYQMKVLVGESSGATGEDVDCDGKCLSSFNDIRFTTSDKTTLLDYWIESISGTTPNQLATVWVEFDSIGTGDTTFYMYYGKADASAASNGVNTFIAFDDFEWGANGTDLTTGTNIAWTKNIGNTPTISTAVKYGGTRSALIPYHATYTLIVCSSEVVNVSIEVQFYKANTTDYNRISVYDGTKAAYIIIDTNENIKDSNSVDTGYDANADTFNRFALNNLNWESSTYDIWHNGIKIKSDAGMRASTAFTDSISFLGSNNNPNPTYIDNFFVRNWRSTEPAWGSWGTEETT